MSSNSGTENRTSSPSYAPGIIMSEAELRHLAEQGRRLHAREIRRFFALAFRGLFRLLTSEKAAPQKLRVWHCPQGQRC
jgi:hypothetical protein